MHVLSDAGSGVQSNGLPCNFYLFFRDLMCSEELTGCVCAIDFETFVWAREFLDETEIVKGRRDVEKFRIEVKLSLTALLSCEQVNADGSVECSRSRSVASFAIKESGMTRTEERFDIWSLFLLQRQQ